MADNQTDHFSEFPIYGLMCLQVLIMVFGSGLSAFAQTRNEALASDEILVGVAKGNITPDVAVRNWVTGEPYTSIHDSIHVRALALSDGRDTSLLITWDLVDAGESATKEIRSILSRALHISPDQIMVHASHNHSAPWSPVFEKGLRGKEVDSWWAIRYMPAQYDYAPYQAWMRDLMVQSLDAAKSAIGTMQVASVWMGRADVSELLRNRRPRSPNRGIISTRMPEDYNYRREDWAPDILGDGKTFGPMDRAMTVVFFEDPEGENLATLLHLAAHAVSIYPFMEGISADWPGETLRRIDLNLGGICLFLQGTAGDINPARRGVDAVNEMAESLYDKVILTKKFGARLEVGTLRNRRSVVHLPLTDYGKELTGLQAMPAEVQVIALGPLALVSLPGEPMTELGINIKEASPLPQTLVLGYTNGKGVYYVGMPQEKKYGGYEAGEKTNMGADSAGSLLIETATNLLKEVQN